MVFEWRIVGKAFVKYGCKCESPVKQLSFAGSAAAFFSNSQILAFFLLNMIPTYLVGTFLTYYFPVFAESRGVSTGDIGRLFILNGLLIVYLGPVTSKWMIRAFGPEKSMLAGGILWALSLAIFGITGTLQGAVITLIAMGLIEGFAATAQNSYFLSLDAVRRIGEDEAIGYYELVGKAGETIGPVAFGFAILLGARKGVIFITALCLAGIILLALLNMRKKIMTETGTGPGRK